MSATLTSPKAGNLRAPPFHDYRNAWIKPDCQIYYSHKKPLLKGSLAGVTDQSSTVSTSSNIAGASLDKMPDHRSEESRVIEHLAINPNVESGLHKIEQNPNQDPAVRQLAIAVLSEFESAKRRRQNRKIGAAIGFFLGIIFGIFLIIIKSAKHR